jgi:hypothetical protein
LQINPARAPISEKLKALLLIAARVREGGKCVTADDVERTRSLGATDLEIHDTVLIAAAFCMYDRYIDGLAAWDPGDEQIYRDVANRVVRWASRSRVGETICGGKIVTGPG